MPRLVCLMLCAVFGMTLCLTTAASAEDTWEYFSVADALSSDYAKNNLDSAIPVYMKGQKTGKVSDPTGEYTANKRSRKFGKSAEEACRDAFISAVLTFQQRAGKEGKNAVVELYSITKDKKFESPDKYSCLVGGMMSNVALRGKVANIAK